MAAKGMADGSHRADFQRAVPLLSLVSFLTLALFTLLLSGIALFGRAGDGEPRVVLDLKALQLRAAPRLSSGAGSGANASGAGGNAAEPVSAAVPPAGAASQGASPASSAPKRVAASKIEKPLFAGRALIADPSLIEQTPAGPLPRIGDDGRLPMTAYAPAVPISAKPRIALVIGGLGISVRETSAALEKLPPQVTLAFAPYTDDAQRWVSKARARGHEVLLEVPMEPYDFPGGDPHTLRATVSEQSNIERLTWSLTRATGYAGITNLLGGRFLANADSVAPVLTFLARRGLMFFESGPENRSVASDVARQAKAPYVQSEIAVDSVLTAMEIDAGLSELESRARAAGYAAGTGFIYPITLERVTIWADGLAGRGFVLVPPSAIVKRAK